MKLEHFGMAEPGRLPAGIYAGCRGAERAITAVQAAPDAPQAEEDGLLTAAVNRTIPGGFSALYEQLACRSTACGTPVTDPDF